MPYDNKILVKVDADGTITYGDDDTEHLTRTPEMRAELLSRIAEMDAVDFTPVEINCLADGTLEIRNATRISS